MKHLYCKKCKGILPKWETICDKCGHINEEFNPIITSAKKRQKIIDSFVIIFVTLIFVVVVPFLPLYVEAYKDKRVAIEYVDTNYPDAKFIKGIYKTQEIRIAAPKPDNRFIFENDGLRFQVSVGEGKIVADSYWKVYAEHQLYNTYLKSFVESRGITADFMYTSSDLQKFYKNNPNANISQFDGSVGFLIVLYGNDESKNPESLGWLYDFYCFCRENITIPEYTVTIQCLGGNVTYSNKSEFNNEADFYNSFD